MEEQKRNPAAGLSESEQVQVRRQKLADLQAAGNDPFTLTKFPQDAYSADLKEEFKELPNETDSGKLVALAGRMMSKRVMGKASFAHLRDDKGDIQLYVRRDELGDEAYAAFKKLDVGDIIGVKGEVFRTKTGELSVRATELTLLAKSLRPLPEKFHGLTDTEMRYRQRYVDLIANPEVKDTFVKRSQILKEIRAYLDEKGFLEVDTPILTPFEIGASARPFYTHHNTLNMDMVLRIETELYLKRLIVGGMDRVYEVGRIFRNEGMDPKHNPEFTTIELYQAFTDFHGMMDLVEELYKRLALKICGSLVIPYQGKQIDMSHWERLTMIEAVKKYSGVDFNDWKTDEDAIASAKEHHVELPEVPAGEGEIVTGTNAEFEPWEFHDGDAIVGIDPEIAGAIAEKLGMELKVEDMAFDAIIPSVASGKCDFAMAGMTVNPERAASVDFTDTYASSSLVILVKADNTEITGEDTLAGHVVGAQLGTTGDTTASDICGDDKVERYNTFFEAVQSLKQGKIDAVLLDKAPANVFLSQNDDLKQAGEELGKEEYAIAVKKGNTELLEKLNAAIAELKEDGTIDEIVNKYIPAE